MKKVSLSLALILVSSTISLAMNQDSKEDDKKKKVTIELEKESKFITSYASEECILSVYISGNSDSSAIVSITNQRGSSILFSAVEQVNQLVEFDLSALAKGIYSVTFITDKEIRIKKVEVK